MVGFTAITCDNRTDGETASIPYTVNSDGTNAIADPHGNLPAACELPWPRPSRLSLISPCSCM